MPNDGKKGITVKVDEALHAEIRQYLENHSMTMTEFVTMALTNELHPENQTKEDKSMANMRTLAFQVPEDLFQRIKDYLHRNNMTQKEFVIGLIEKELERDLRQQEGVRETEGPSEELETGIREDEPVEMAGDVSTDETETMTWGGPMEGKNAEPVGNGPTEDEAETMGGDSPTEGEAEAPAWNGFAESESGDMAEDMDEPMGFVMKM